MFSVGQAFHMVYMHVLLRKRLVFLMRDSTEQGSRRGFWVWGSQGPLIS
jgi:hypothetical protein